MQPAGAQPPQPSGSPPGDEPAQRGTDAQGFAQLVEGASDVRVDMARLSALMGCLDERLQRRKRRAQEEAVAGMAKVRADAGGGRHARARRRAEGLIRGVREAQAEVDNLSAEKINISRQLYDSLDRFICELDRRFTLVKNHKPNQDVVPVPVAEPQSKRPRHAAEGTSNGQEGLESPSSQSDVPLASSSSAQRQTLEVEPTYCTCGRGYFGLMVCCDNPNCKIGWYHASCLGLKDSEVRELPSKWTCPACEQANGVDVEIRPD